MAQRRHPKPVTYGTTVGITTLALGLVGFALGVSGRAPLTRAGRSLASTPLHG